ncbi:hypothetical protein [Sinorhizobium chiapasense]|uniref:Uncharacterized protein n=1 Tax=Sinorhizobium chiapasense TaxID=501572 RepID=A0ABZ2BLN6_9HYPH
MARENRYRAAGTPDAPWLVYPVVYSDGKNFDDRAQRVQARNLSQFAYPYDSFRDTESYMHFDDAVRAIAEEVETRLNSAPAWEPDFPLADVQQAAQGNPRLKLPRL